MEENPFNLYTDDYEKWFKKNETIFQSELLALKQVVPIGKKGIEIGVGSGIFAEKLAIKFGIDPSENMLNYAKKRNIKVKKGYAENLPYPKNSFDFVVFITSICFIDNPPKALNEAYRILKDEGNLIIAFIDKDSFLGETMISKKQESRFYKDANFYTATEMISLIETHNFKISEVFQTLTELKKNEIEQPIKGFGKGGFIVLKGEKIKKE